MSSEAKLRVAGVDSFLCLGEMSPVPIAAVGTTNDKQPLSWPLVDEEILTRMLTVCINGRLGKTLGLASIEQRNDRGTLG